MTVKSRKNVGKQQEAQPEKSSYRINTATNPWSSLGKTAREAGLGPGPCTSATHL